MAGGKTSKYVHGMLVISSSEVKNVNFDMKIQKMDFFHNVITIFFNLKQFIEMFHSVVLFSGIQ